METTKLHKLSKSSHSQPIHYKIQCFTDDEILREYLSCKFIPVAEGDSSIVLAVSKRRLDSFLFYINKYSILITVKEIRPITNTQPKLLEKIQDTIKFNPEVFKQDFETKDEN